MVEILKIASQVGEGFNTALRDRLGHVDIVAIPAGVPANLPGDIKALVAYPMKAAGQDDPPRPEGWPFGLQLVQMVSVGKDLYPDWLFDAPMVTCARGATSEALAEFGLAAIFGAAKCMPDIWISSAEQWRLREISMVRGKTLGLFGFGGIGSALAPKAIALGMKVVATRRTDSPFDVPGVERVETLAELLSCSDHLVLAAPATPSTEGVLNDAMLRHAKPGIHIINLARGSLIDEQALIKALDDGRVSLASLDVAAQEPPQPDHPFYTHPRIRLSPHVAVMTEDVGSALVEKLAINFERFRSGVRPVDVVDVQRGY